MVTLSFYLYGDQGRDRRANDERRTSQKPIFNPNSAHQ